MEELDLKELLEFFLSKIYIVLVITICCVVISIFYGSVIKKPLYQSYTTLLLAGSNIDTGSNETSNLNDLTLNQRLVPTYREIIKSGRIASQVINNLHLDMSEDYLKGLITVTSESNTELIKITVSHENAQLASEIANSIVEVFSKEIVEIYNIKNVKLMEEAKVAEEPYNINIVKQMIITLFIAAVLSFVDIFILFYFDTSIKTIEEVERKVNLPILGTIPDSMHKGGSKK